MLMTVVLLTVSVMGLLVTYDSWHCRGRRERGTGASRDHVTSHTWDAIRGELSERNGW